MQVNFNAPNFRPNFKASLDKNDSDTVNTLEYFFHQDPTFAHAISLAFEDIPTEDTFSLRRENHSLKIKNNNSGKSTTISNCNNGWSAMEKLLKFVTSDKGNQKKVFGEKLTNKPSNYFTELAHNKYKEYMSKTKEEISLEERRDKYRTFQRKINSRIQEINDQLRDIDNDKTSSYRNFITDKLFS